MTKPITHRPLMRPGQPTKRTPETVAKIMDAYAKGITFEESCNYAGVTEQTGYNWQTDPEFFEALQKARTLRKLNLIDTLQADPQGWQRFAWLLERLDPKSFSRPEIQLNQQVNVAGNLNIVQCIQENAPAIRALLEGNAPDEEPAP